MADGKSQSSFQTTIRNFSTKGIKQFHIVASAISGISAFYHFCILLFMAFPRSAISDRHLCNSWHFRTFCNFWHFHNFSSFHGHGNFDWPFFHCVYIDVQVFISFRAFYMDRIKVYVMQSMQCFYCFVLQILTSKFLKCVGGSTWITYNHGTSLLGRLQQCPKLDDHQTLRELPSNVQSWTIINHYENSPEKHAKCTPR